MVKSYEIHQRLKIWRGRKVIGISKQIFEVSEESVSEE